MSGNGLRPQNRSEARRWNRFSRREWDWISIRHWPRHLALAYLLGRVKNPERFGFFMYFVGNGMDPQMAVDTILSMQKFDAEARNQMQWLLRNSDTVLQRYKYWDEFERKYI